MIRNDIDKNELNGEIEVIQSRVSVAKDDLQKILDLISEDKTVNNQTIRLILLSRVGEMCKQMLYTIRRIKGQTPNQANLILTAIESLDEVSRLIKTENIDIDKSIAEIVKVSTISEKLK